MYHSIGLTTQGHGGIMKKHVSVTHGQIIAKHTIWSHDLNIHQNCVALMRKMYKKQPNSHSGKQEQSKERWVLLLLFCMVRGWDHMKWIPYLKKKSILSSIFHSLSNQHLNQSKNSQYHQKHKSKLYISTDLIWHKDHS